MDLSHPFIDEQLVDHTSLDFKSQIDKSFLMNNT